MFVHPQLNREPALPGLLRDLLGRGIHVRLTVHGSSMSPGIRAGDTITLAPILPGDVRRGDVVAGEAAGRLVVHRVAGIHGHGVTLRGDAPGERAETVDAEAVLGKVIYLERAGRPSPLAAAPSVPVRTLQGCLAVARGAQRRLLVRNQGRAARV